MSREPIQALKCFCPWPTSNLGRVLLDLLVLMLPGQAGRMCCQNLVGSLSAFSATKWIWKLTIPLAKAEARGIVNQTDSGYTS